MVAMVRMGCTLGGWLWTGYTLTLASLGFCHSLYQCCAWFSSSSLWDRTSGESALLLTGMCCGSRVGGSHSLTGAINSALCSGSKYRCPGGSSCWSVARWMIGAMLPVMRACKWSIACNSSWGASLWHCIAVARFFCLDDSVDRSESGSFYGMVIIFPRVVKSGWINEGAKYQALNTW